METVTLTHLYHRYADWIGIYFPNTVKLNRLAREIPGIKYSRQNRCWYIPISREGYKLVKSKFSTVALVNNQPLKDYLIKRRQFLEKGVSSTGSFSANAGKSPGLPKPFVPPVIDVLSAENRLALDKFVERLKMKAYSPSTIRTYSNEFTQLLSLLKKKKAEDLTVEEIKRYMVFIMERQGVNENTAHSRLNALKFYFEQVLGREKFFWDIPRPKKPQQLPKLLNENEIRRLFNALANKKHKAMLFTAYSAGLRVSEIVNLKIADIDSGRMQIFIEHGKGKKDRCVNLSPVLLDILRNYIQSYRPKPKKFLFESEHTGDAYPIRTVQQIFTNAKNKAGILKAVGVHSLRHSFATHLLDKGTDIKYIKDLLGHFNIKTTERYLHVSKQQLVNIVSPFDDLWNNEKIDW